MFRIGLAPVDLKNPSRNSVDDNPISRAVKRRRPELVRVRVTEIGIEMYKPGDDVFGSGFEHVATAKVTPEMVEWLQLHDRCIQVHPKVFKTELVYGSLRH